MRTGKKENTKRKIKIPVLLEAVYHASQTAGIDWTRELGVAQRAASALQVPKVLALVLFFSQ
jgi:hypothetical protein